jgi:uncharacterized protein YecT (DUF1311 family)
VAAKLRNHFRRTKRNWLAAAPSGRAIFLTLPRPVIIDGGRRIALHGGWEFLLPVFRSALIKRTNLFPAPLVLLILIGTQCLKAGPGVETQLEYPDGTLLKGSGPKVYVVLTGQRHWIPDPNTFNARGYHWDAIRQVADDDLNAVPEGTQLPSVNTVDSEALTRSIQNAESRLNHVYKRLVNTLDLQDKAALKQEEIVWIRRKDALAGKDRLMAIESRISDLQRRLSPGESEQTASTTTDEERGVSEETLRQALIDFDQ